MSQKNGSPVLNARIKNHPMQITKHHVPPRVPDASPRPIILRKERRHHEAWHLLFQNCPDLKTAIFILQRDWFPNEQLPIL